MFRWLRHQSGPQSGDGKKPDPLHSIDGHTDLDRLWEQELVMLFKHSPSCSVSWAAHAHVVRFHAAHPEVPIHMVSVVRERAVSRAIAERTQVEHESPQIIVLRRGEVASVASHGEISCDNLESMLD